MVHVLSPSLALSFFCSLSLLLFSFLSYFFLFVIWIFLIVWVYRHFSVLSKPGQDSRFKCENKRLFIAPRSRFLHLKSQHLLRHDHYKKFNICNVSLACWWTNQRYENPILYFFCLPQFLRTAPLWCHKGDIWVGEVLTLPFKAAFILFLFQTYGRSNRSLDRMLKLS